MHPHTTSGDFHPVYTRNIVMEDTTILPDIGENGVYETSDVDEPIDIVEKNEYNSDIECQPVSITDSRASFAPEVLEASWTVDFLGSANQDDLYSSGYRAANVKETPRMRLARIERELLEIKEDLNEEDSQKCNLLYEYVTKADKKEMNGHWNHVKEAFELCKPKVTTENEQASHTAIDHSHILAVEKKITHLENAVGSGNFNLSGVIEDLRRKIEMATSTLFEPLQENIKQLNVDLERLLEQKKQLNILTEDSFVDSGNDAKTEELYNALPEINRTAAMVPGIITRLKSLSTVHADIGSTVLLSDTIDDVLQDMQSEMQKWKTSLQETNTNLDKYEKVFEQNKADVLANLSRWTLSPTTAVRDAR